MPSAFTLDDWLDREDAWLVPGALRNRDSRGRFLDWLAESPSLKPYFAVTRIVFDAQHASRDWGTTTHRGLTVTFSFRQTADDLIETYLALDKNPQKIRLVSNDHRLQAAAKRVRAKPMACSEFVDWLADPVGPGDGPKDYAPTAQEKPESSEGELAEYLRVFGTRKTGH